MKKYGHTGTLFIQAGKYKWSYKHDYCIECKQVKFKHKGKGLCTSCFDKQRKEKSKTRRLNLKRQQAIHYYKTRVLLFLEKKEHKKKKRNFTKEMEIEYKKKWYKENRPALLLIRKAERMRKRGEDCLKMYINGKERYFPFDGIERPNCDVRSKDFEEYEKLRREFDILKKYYERTA